MARCFGAGLCGVLAVAISGCNGPPLGDTNSELGASMASPGGSAGSAGSVGSNGVAGTIASSGATPNGVAGTIATSGVAPNGATVTGDVDLCAGLVSDKQPHSMTPLPKPALGETVVDAEFGTTIRRITAVPGSGANAAIVPLYTTISAWNADESRMILFQATGGNHLLYDGKTYQFIRTLDIHPPDIEQVYWDTSDPDLLYYLSGQDYIRYHVTAGTAEKIHNFGSLCGSSGVSGGTDPMFTSWDSHRVGLYCGEQMFIYDASTDSVLGPRSTNGFTNGWPPANVAPSGTLAYLADGSGQVLDANLNLVRSLGLHVPWEHSSLGRLANGHDTWNGAVYDDGNDDAQSNVGILVTFDLTNGTGGALIGPKTGYPYPPAGHISAMAYKRPGWVFVSTYGYTSVPGLLDMENLIANTNTGVVCRAGRHRSWGKDNEVLGYWAEPHTVPSPSGTRAVFASDWGNGTSVDSYVLELPSYQ